MKRVHPKLSRRAADVLIVLSIGVVGCKSTSSGIGNPFLSPDRVPPPSTHALLPGQAQPYYQGDPLPAAAQGPVGSATSAVAANATQATLSSTGRTLAWNTPGVVAPTTPVVPTVPPSQPIAAANERSVAVPTDADPLRYPLPTPREAENAAPLAASAPAKTIPPTQALAAHPQQNVLLASYNAPITGTPSTLINVPTIVPPQQASSPWRAPQVTQPATSPTYASQPGAMLPLVGSPLALPAPPTSVVAQQTVAIPPNTIGATLRAVASPSPESGDPMPRIRMPDYLPPPPIGTADGFRPRTSMQ